MVLLPVGGREKYYCFAARGGGGMEIIMRKKLAGLMLAGFLTWAVAGCGTMDIPLPEIPTQADESVGDSLEAADDHLEVSENSMDESGKAEATEESGQGLYSSVLRVKDSPEWVTKLAAAGDEDTTQMFVVGGMGKDLTTASISFHERDEEGNWKQLLSTPGYVGKNGLCLDEDHVEGCGQTPTGIYHFNKAFGIAPDPGCAIPYTQVDEDTYWSGDDREGMHYNEMVDLKDFPELDMTNSEHIVEYDYQYQYCLNISFNEEGTPGRGSAIFLHCLGPEKPYTGGCVAIPENIMRLVMQNVDEDCVVVIDTLENMGGSFDAPKSAGDDEKVEAEETSEEAEETETEAVEASEEAEESETEAVEASEEAEETEAEAAEVSEEAEESETEAEVASEEAEESETEAAEVSEETEESSLEAVEDPEESDNAEAEAAESSEAEEVEMDAALVSGDSDVLLSGDSSDFVLLTDAVPDAILEIRYYSTYNFVGDRIDGYEEPLAFLTKEAAAALKEVSDEVMEKGYRLKIYDAYRPQEAVTNFMNWALDAEDVRMKDYFYPELDKEVLFPQGYIAEHSGHSRGSTVDLTLFDMALEKEVDMGGSFDYFGELSHPDYTDITEEQYQNRMILREAMMNHGFRPLDEEWWHFTLDNEPYPDTYFTFPVNSESLDGE